MKKRASPQSGDKRSKNYSILKRLWPLVKPHSGFLWVGLVALAVTTTLMLALPQYLRMAFDAALKTNSLAAFNTTFVIAGATALALALFAFIRIVCLEYAGSLALNTFRRELFAHVLKLHIGFFESRPAGEIISRITADATTIRLFIQINLPQFARGIALFSGLVVMLFVTNWRLSLLLLVVVPVAAVISRVLGQKMRVYARQLQDYSANIGALTEENIYGMRTVQAYTSEAGENTKFGVLQSKALNTALRWIVAYASFISSNVIIGFGAMLLVLWVGGHQVLAGSLSLGELMAYVLYLAFMADAVSTLTNFYPALQTATGATERVFELMAEPIAIADPKNPKALPTAKTGRKVVFDAVSFAYPSRPDADVLKDISLTINAGETVAVVGRSGAGKSTLFNLLLRFYEPTQGKITVDGLAVDSITLADLRTTLGYVAQEATVFSTTIAENLRYAKPNASNEELWQALKTAHAETFIKALPNGLETEVGEKGVRLSGGQKQRLAIARAVLRNPQVLLLDEATSHLDAESEHAVQQAFAEVMQNRTTLVIAHRLATVQAADKIVVLDNGKIAAMGTHKELLKTSPLYQHLAELQLLGA